jgi:hypothetical protein
MRTRTIRFAGLIALLVLALPAKVRAEATQDRFSAGGYFRIMTRPDFQGGASELGYWNLYGRLLNEGPWGALELKLDIVQNNPGRNDPWTSVYCKIEGGSFANTDRGRGNLGNYANTQLYVKAGNILLDHVTWQIGTLYTYPGDLGLYDMRPADLFWDTVGLSATYESEKIQLILGLGDAGFAIRGLNYSTILTAGGFLKFHVPHFEIGAGGQFRYEPQVKGNKNAPYATPDISYEDYVRHEVVKNWLEEHPGQQLNFPNPDPKSSQSYKLVAYLGFGGFGPFRWDSLYFNFQRLHPDNFYTESYGGQDYTIYVHDLTDQRFSWLLGNETSINLAPDRLDLELGLLYGHDYNNKNTVAPGDDNRTYMSAVLRLQLYLTKTLHLLAESSVAHEKSDLGNKYREHYDSIFANTAGVPDSRGLEYGDSDTRNTWQLKAGFVINPTGIGIFQRPSLRILYGLQYSSQQAAYGTSFVDSLDQYNVFTGSESHWHHVLAIEAEAWF